MPNHLTDYVRQQYIKVTGKQFCTNCRVDQDRAGGSVKLTNNGKNQRWVCKLCTAKKIAQLAQNKKDERVTEL